MVGRVLPHYTILMHRLNIKKLDLTVVLRHMNKQRFIGPALTTDEHDHKAYSTLQQ